MLKIGGLDSECNGREGNVLTMLDSEQTFINVHYILYYSHPSPSPSPVVSKWCVLGTFAPLGPPSPHH